MKRFVRLEIDVDENDERRCGSKCCWDGNVHEVEDYGEEPEIVCRLMQSRWPDDTEEGNPMRCRKCLDSEVPHE